MIQHCVLGQAGSGKSTFIEKIFPRDEFIFFSVGNILREMFSCLKKKQRDNNVWELANPLVYSIYKHCCWISNKYEYPLVTDGFPRNTTQLSHMNRYLTTPKLGKVSVCIHMLDISEEEQIKRINNRNSGIDDYQAKRIKQSRDDFNEILDALEVLMEDPNNNINYEIKWYNQKNGDFILDRHYK